MHEILIARSATYAAKISAGTISGINEVNLLALGAVAIFADDNTMIAPASAVADLADKKAIWIAVGTGDATKGAHITKHIPRLKTRYDKKAYVAPVKQVKVIGSDATLGALNFPSPLIAGTDIFVKITETSIGYRTGSTDIHSYSDIVNVSDTTATILARIAATINADPASIVTAAVVAGNVGITLTAKNNGVTFDIALDGVFINSTVVEKENLTYATSVVAAAPTYGNGTYDSLLQLENFFSTERGNTNQVWLANRFWSVSSEAVSGSTYDMYNIKWMGYKTSGAEGSQPVVAHEVVFALPVGATQQANCQTIFAEAFGNAETEETGA